MSWTTPKDWSYGETAHAVDFNTHIRDHMNATAPAILTTKGDLLVATAAGTVTRLGVGADNTVLVADSAQTAGVAWKAYLAPLTLFGTGNGDNVGFGATKYAAPAYTGLAATSAAIARPAPFAGTIKNFSVNFYSGNSANGTVTVTILINHVASAVLVTLAGSGAAAVVTDSTHSAAVTAGQLLSIQVTVAGSSGSCIIGGFSFEIVAGLTT